MPRFFDFLRPDHVEVALTLPYELYSRFTAQEQWLKRQVRIIMAKLKNILAKKSRYLRPNTIQFIRLLINGAKTARPEFSFTPSIVMRKSAVSNYFVDPLWIRDLTSLYNDIRQTVGGKKRGPRKFLFRAVKPSVEPSFECHEDWEDWYYTQLADKDDEALENEEFSPPPRFLGIGRAVGQSDSEQERRKASRKRAGKKRDRRALWDSRNGAKTRKHHPLKLTRKEQLARKLSVDLLSMEAAVERAIKQLKHQLTS